MSATDRRRFEGAQRRYVAAWSSRGKYRLEVLLRRYGRIDPPHAWLLRSEIARLEQFDRAMGRASDSLFAVLDHVGGRDWGSHAPHHWIMTELSWSDATTTGALSVVPPPGYGYSERDMERFAELVS